MSVLIGHASIDEHGKTSGGKAGDSTRKEVCIREWYNKGWNLLLRPKDSVIADKSAKFVEDVCNNNNVGYDQSGRNSLYIQAKNVNYNGSKISLCECDCSSFMHVAAIAGGANIPYIINGATTRTLRTVLGNSGYYDILTDSKYLTSDKYLKRGDILVKEGAHTVMVLENGSNEYNQSSTSHSKLVIDISHHNTIKDWNLITETDSIIIRAGYISYQSGTLTTDKKFTENIKQTISHNKKVGIYAWDQSLNEQEAIELANYIIGLIKPYKISLPVYIDSEAYKDNKGRADKISKEQRTKNIIAFCETIKNAGYIPGVYASDSWFKSMLDFEQIKNYEIWCARYSTNKPTISKYDAWQYGSKQFPWSTAPIDVNYFYKDYSNSSNNSSSTPIIKNIVKVNTTLNVRNKPNGTIVDKLKNGDEIDISNYQNGWFEIGKDRWVSADYVYNTYGIVTANTLNIRSGAGTNYQDIGDLKNNENVRILKELNGWYLVLCGTRYGWASAKYIQLI